MGCPAARMERVSGSLRSNPLRSLRQAQDKIWTPGGRGFCCGAGREAARSQCLDKLDNQKMLDAKRGGDWAREQSAATIAHPSA